MIVITAMSYHDICFLVTKILKQNRNMFCSKYIMESYIIKYFLILMIRYSSLCQAETSIDKNKAMQQII